MFRCGRGGEARRCIPGENERPALARGESVCKGVGNNQHRAVPAVEHEKTSHAHQGTEVSELGTSREDFPGGSVARNQPANAEGGLIPGSRRPREEGLAAHSSFLPGGPTDRGSRRAAVPGVAKSRARLASRHLRTNLRKGLCEGYRHLTVLSRFQKPKENTAY